MKRLRNIRWQLLMPLLLTFSISAGSSRAGQIVRDQYWPANSNGVWEFGSSTQGTIIGVSVPGQLSRIELYMNIKRWPPNNPWTAADLQWSIRNIENGLPTAKHLPPLASGTIPGSEFSYAPKAMLIDASPFDLYFEGGSRFALTLTGGSGATYRWMSYRGYDAPQGPEFYFDGVAWRVIGPFDYDPPYSAGYSTFIEAIPEPNTLLLVLIAMVALASRRRFCSVVLPVIPAHFDWTGW